MAKAKQVEGLDCDADATKMAAEVLRVRFYEIPEFHAAALERDRVDGVHDMRVASRRFRSALQDFGPLFDKKAIKPVKKSVKEVADALGNVRDQDVAVAALGELRDKSPNEAIAGHIDILIESRRAQRAEAYSEMLERVTSDRLDSLEQHLEKALNANDLKANEAPTFGSFALDAIDRALDKFVERAENIYDPFDDKALHKLRLSAKRLRYALELFDPCWMGELKPFAKYLSKIQSSLGKVHDSADWIEYLSKTIRQDNGLDRQTAAWLISEFVSLRTTEYIKALELWNEWLAADIEEKLRAATRNSLNDRSIRE